MRDTDTLNTDFRADEELLSRLCLCFGPTGCEETPDALIRQELCGICDRVDGDSLGNTYAYIGNSPEKKTLMFCAHKDEVGFIITGISDDGMLYFETVGGIDPAVYCGKRVFVRALDGRLLCGIIPMLPIHMTAKEDRTVLPHAGELYIDVGAGSPGELDGLVRPGCYAEFEPSFTFIGEGGRLLAAKATDDRVGCAAMLCAARELYKTKNALPVNVVFAFTVREEIGISGAGCAAHRIAPDYAVVLESTAASDLAGVPEHSRVAYAGGGGAISLMDRSTVYDRNFVRFAMSLAEKLGIPAQLKKFVSGGNDAGAVHRSREGIRTLAISVPSRYIHSPVCVSGREDYHSAARLSVAIALHADKLDARKESI